MHKRIGGGGMANVWFSHFTDGPMIRPCAVKVLRDDLEESGRLLARFSDEAKIASTLHHRNIVQVTGTGTFQGQPFMAMEWVDGVDLRELWREAKRDIAIEVACYIVGEVLEGLVYAHERTIAGRPAGVIHHDVTPANILISSSGEVRLTDFGIARLAATANQTLSAAMGTPRYMPIEQRMGRADPKTDIYSLGVVLHELLEGRYYMEDETPTRFQELVLAGHVPPLERSDVPPWLDQLRRQMLAGEIEQRPRAVEALDTIIHSGLRYKLAGTQLKALYKRLIGGRRSGFTDVIPTSYASQSPSGRADQTGSADADIPTHWDAQIIVTPGGRAAAPRTRTNERVYRAAPAPTHQAPLTHQTPPGMPVAQSGFGDRRDYAPTTRLPFGAELQLDVPVDRELAATAYVPAPPPLPSAVDPLVSASWAGSGAGLNWPRTIAIVGGVSISVLAAAVVILLALPNPAEAERTGVELAATSPAGVSLVLPVSDDGGTDEPDAEPEPPSPSPSPNPGPNEVPLEHEPLSDPAPASPLASTDVTPGEAVETPEDPPPEDPGPTPKAPKPKTEVAFIIDGVKTADIKVGAKTLQYKHIAMGLFRVGRHRVQWRPTGGEWTSVGRLKVKELPKGWYYEVTISGDSLAVEQRQEGSK